MTRYERAKAWAKRNEDKIFVVGTGIFIVGFVVVVVKSNAAYQERVTSELNYAIDQLNAVYRAKELELV